MTINLESRILLRSLFGYIMLLYVLFWLVFSYLPESVVSLPEITFPSAWDIPLFQPLFLVCAILFVLIQVRIVIATGAFFKGKPYLYSQDLSSQSQSSQEDSLLDGDRKRVPSFQLGRNQEMFWTILPVLMTVLVFIAGYIYLTSAGIRTGMEVLF